MKRSGKNIMITAAVIIVIAVIAVGFIIVPKIGAYKGALKVGDNVTICCTGDIMETAPAQISDVTRIMLLDDEL